MRNSLLLLAGLVVYAGYGLGGFAGILAAALVSYGTALLIPRKKGAMWITAGIGALVLTLVKLQPVTGMVFSAPLGISYFTLRIISYNVDVYRGKYPPERNFLRYCLYVTFLPHIYLGPIERYDGFRNQLENYRRLNWEDFSLGGLRVLWGGFKKLAIATRAGVLVGTISAAPETYRGAYALFAMVLYSVQLYADFSGGIDMVLGLCRMLGMTFSENFNAPYFSQSVQEFWRRWHMTLGGWLREYVYIPLGGNRKGKGRKLLNTIVTFLVSGLWHGVHYLLWGLFNGIFVAFGEKLKTRWKLANQIGTFGLISFLWAFFVWLDTRTALAMIGSVFTTFNYGTLFGNLLELGLNMGEWLVFVGAVAVLWAYDGFRDRINSWLQGLCPAARVAVMGALGLTILIFGMYGIGFNAEEFIYSNF